MDGLAVASIEGSIFTTTVGRLATEDHCDPRPIRLGSVSSRDESDQLPRQVREAPGYVGHHAQLEHDRKGREHSSQRGMSLPCRCRGACAQRLFIWFGACHKHRYNFNVTRHWFTLPSRKHLAAKFPRLLSSCADMRNRLHDSFSGGIRKTFTSIRGVVSQKTSC
jgi:hypothetical protein